MSRNIRRKQPSTTAARRGSDSSSSLNLSSDDENGYSGVEDVSDSDEDDEQHVFAAEEEHLKEQVTHASRKRSTVPPRPLESEDDDADEEAEDDEEEADEDVPEDDENGSWDGILSEPESTTTEAVNYNFEQELANVERHVRFTGVPDSDSDSTTSEMSEDDAQDFFPDIFVDQNALDPAFRRELEKDYDSSNSGSFWDFHNNSQEFMHAEVNSDEDNDDTPTATPRASQAPTEASTPIASTEFQELDGYETDGDTTEEDDPVKPPVRQKQIRRVVHSELSSDSDTEKPTPFRRGKPRLGPFNLDDTKHKPVAVLNPTTRKMMIFTPQRNSRLDLSPESFNIDFGAQDLTSCSPILSNPGFVMMGAMFSCNTFGDFMNTQPYGPAEAFFPLTSDPPMEDFSDDSEFALRHEDEGESQLNVEDFLTFHHDSSDEEEEEEEEVAEWTGGLESSPTRPRTAASTLSAVSATTDLSAMDVHPLLSHFDNNSNVVGAFRRNQINQQLISSNQATQDSLPFSGPLHYGTLRGIKTGSMETVTTPITPARRHKKPSLSDIHGFNNTMGSPSSQKRKASTNLTDNLHKKQRSISELGILQI